MLPKHRRLGSRGVTEVLAEGRGRRATVLSLKILATTTPFRCAVVVSKKVAGSAVKRNALRRSLYHVLAHASLPPTGHAILFVQSAPPLPYAVAFASDLKKLFYV
jgi:ribonuclease P protein component